MLNKTGHVIWFTNYMALLDILQQRLIPDRCRTPLASTVGDECCGTPGCQEQEVGQHYADSS